MPSLASSDGHVWLVVGMAVLILVAAELALFAVVEGAVSKVVAWCGRRRRLMKTRRREGQVRADALCLKQQLDRQAFLTQQAMVRLARRQHRLGRGDRSGQRRRT